MKQLFAVYLRIFNQFFIFYNLQQNIFVICYKRNHDHYSSSTEFKFTAPQYNLSIFENAATGTFARLEQSYYQQFSNYANKIGVFLPKGYNNVNFKIVEGDKQQNFNAIGKRLGNFVFMNIECRHDDFLNRELQSEYRFLIKAIAKKKKLNTIETSTIVNLKIIDENDNNPMFRQMQYFVELDDRLPINSKIIQLDGFDADEGLNGQLWFSQLNHSDQFYVEPDTGWIRNFANLNKGKYTLKYKIEDRSSRLFYNNEKQKITSLFGFFRNYAQITINVIPKRNNTSQKPQVYIEKISYEPFQQKEQLIAIIKIVDFIVNADMLELKILTENNFLRLEKHLNGTYYIYITNSTDFLISINLELFEIFLNKNSYYLNKILKFNITVSPDMSKRKIWFDFAANKKVILNNKNLSQIKIKVNEITPVNTIIEQFYVKTTYKEDMEKIRYKLQLINENYNKLEEGQKFYQKTKNNSYFELDYYNGQLLLKRFLDYDDKKQQKTYHFYLISIIETKNTIFEVEFKTYVELIIEVVDFNDNCPIFSSKFIPKNFELYVQCEKIKKNTNLIVYKPQVYDIDSGKNREIVFKLIGVDDSKKFFNINYTTGEITFSNINDEDKSEWIIKILALDLGLPISQYSELTLKILCKNIGYSILNNPKDLNFGVKSTCNLTNKFAPSFENNNFEIEQDIPVGKVIGKVKAIDADLGYNGIVYYVTNDVYFGIDEYSGEIFVRQSLINLFEQKKLTKNANFFDYKLKITAKNVLDYVNKKEINQEFNIRIKVANLHDPIFKKLVYNVEIDEHLEPGIEIIKVEATDKDFGFNGLIKYSFAVNVENFFSIDSTTGVIKLEKLIDREVTEYDEKGLTTHKFLEEIDLLIMASDQGQPERIGFSNLIIQINDINDNKPYCLQDVYSVSIFEDSPYGQLILCVSASDIDANENAALEFELNEKDLKTELPFKIDRYSGCIFADNKTPFDYEKKSVYAFSVKVIDNGKLKQLNTFCQVKIFILDVNENVYPPQFSEIALEASVEENSLPKTEIIKVQAFDPENSIVTYKLCSALGLFEIDEKTGIIQTTMQLDFEETSFYWLTVRAQDHTTNKIDSLFSNLHVLVRVLDKNDRFPLFTQPTYFASILENSPENKIITKIEAIDPDNLKSNDQLSYNLNYGNIKYSIIKGNPQSNFAIDENTGYIVSGKRRLDRETQSEHELHVKACDSGKPQLCSTTIVVVNVLDSNDCAPSFSSNTLTINVPADKILNSYLCRIFATDLDNDELNSEIVYKIISKDNQENFTIDNYGRIFATEPLKAGNQIKLLISAEDKGFPRLKSNVSVTLVALGRVNKFTVSNRAPRLVDSSIWRELYVSDSDSVGTIVGIIKAIDDDNDPLWWFINENLSVNPNNTFTFQGNNGELILANPINKINSSLNEIKLVFTVTDGIDNISNEIKIRISRSTNARPTFANLISVVKLDVNSPIGSIVYSPKIVFDKINEISNTHQIIFSIHAVDNLAAKDVFRVDQNSGNIIIEKLLSQIKLPKNFSLIISAKKFGQETLSRVEFHLKSINNYAPVFVFNYYDFLLFNYKKDYVKKIYVGSVKAYDLDWGKNGQINYLIINGNELKYFVLNSTTGDIFFNNYLNVIQNLSSQFTLTVRAIDFGVNSKSGTCIVRISTTNFLKQEEKKLKQFYLSKRFYYTTIENKIYNSFFISSIETKNINGLLSYTIKDEQNYQYNICSQLLNINFFNGRVFLSQTYITLKNLNLINCTIVIKASSIYTFHTETVYLLIKIVSSNYYEQMFFTKNIYYGSIVENAQNGSSVLSVKNDKEFGVNNPLIISLFYNNTDKILAKNNYIYYKILSMQKSPFYLEKQNLLNKNNFFIRSFYALDYEKIKKWRFLIIAQKFDKKNKNFLKSLTYTKKPTVVEISIIDVNDCSPYFTVNSEILLPAVPIHGLYVTTVTAKDSDTVGNLRYAIRQTDSSKIGLKTKIFYINQFTGTITVNSNTSNFFNLQTYALKIYAFDGVHTNYTTIKINFYNSTTLFSWNYYSLDVTENITNNDNFLQKNLSIWHNNIEFGETITFQLLNSNHAFIINSQSGILSLNKSYILDREVNDKYQLLIQAISNENQKLKKQLNFLIVNVNVEDINDCAPKFIQNFYFATIPEDAEIGYRVTTIKAKDADLGMSGVVRYYLDNNAPSFFIINKYDGRITLATNITSKQHRVGSQFSFFVIATDKGTPTALKSSVEVKVEITDKNKPTFLQSYYFVKISETTLPGSHIVTVQAISNNYGIIGYQIKNGNNFCHFSIDFSKGTIILNEALNYKNILFYNLTVEAIDLTRPQISPALTNVLIKIDYINNLPPKFETFEYKWKVNEDTEIGSLVGFIKAHDAILYKNTESDILFNDNNESILTYSIEKGNKSVISINAVTGQLSLTSKLDYETQDFYPYIVRVTNLNGFFNEAILKIFVEDTNDQPPIWHGPNPIYIYLFSNFSRNQPQFLYALNNHVTDFDTVSSLPLVSNFSPPYQFDIVDGDQTLFKLNKYSGVLETSQELNENELNELIKFDENNQKNIKFLNVSIFDGLFQIFVLIKVELLHKPSSLDVLQFEQLYYTAEINENRISTNKSAIAVIKAKGGKNISYGIAGLDNSLENLWPISVEKESGRVFLSKKLDREKMFKQLINVPLYAQDNFNRLAFTHIDVYVNDENDNSPIWIAPNDGYSVCIDLSAYEKEPIALVMATDMDFNDRLEYSLLSGINNNGINAQKYFDIDSTQGYITLKENANSTNFLALPDFFSFFIRVSDTGNPPHQSKIKFNVRFIKSGQIVPHFSQLYYLFTIFENASINSVVGQLCANHLKQNFQNLRFTLISNNFNNIPIAINESTGEIKLKMLLDFETKSIYHLLVQIENNEKLYSYAIVTINVLNVNDNPPIFKTIYKKIEVKENTNFGTIIAVFAASDADQQSSSFKIIYSIENESLSDFVIDPEFGWLMIGPNGLDRERQEIYKLKIIASDENELSTHQIVEIIVADVNDSPPEFDRKEYNIEFNVSNLDYPKKISLQNNALKKFFFNVKDQDKINSIDKLQVFVIRCENSNKSEKLIDENFNYLKTLNNSVFIESWSIEKIYTNTKKKLIIACLIVTDGLYYGYATAKIKLKIIKKNLFQNLCNNFNSSLITIPSNLSVGNEIYSFLNQHTNTDFINLNYYLLNNTSTFLIKNNSKIVIANPEYYKNFNHTISIAIFAHYNMSNKKFNYKKNFFCYKNIQVIVQITNRMTPVIENKNLKVSLPENINVTKNQLHFVMKLSAKDNDCGNYGKLKYFIDEKRLDVQKNFSISFSKKNILDYFSLDKNTGVLALKKPLDREQISFYSIPICVKDGGDLFTTTNVTIYVDDVNDNAPVFKQSLYSLKVLENEALGHELVIIQASDKDLNSKLRYSIDVDKKSDINVTNYIKIDEQTGVLKLVGVLNYEEIKKLSFVVMVTDQKFFSKCNVEIEILDVNDNAPKFDKLLYEIEIQENSTIGTKILKVFAHDIDSEHFGRVSYKLSSNDEINSVEYFLINDEGWIILNKLLDYEQIKILRLNVHALDGGQPSLSDDAIVQIFVQDVNDNPPQFAVCNMTAVVQEGVDPGQTLLTVMLTDPDSALNGPPFRLELIGENSTAFAFDPLQNLITTQKISYTKHKQFTLLVKASDVGGLSSTCPLRIFVKPQSKYPPSVKPLFIILNLLMGEYLGGFIGKISAKDQDYSDMLRFSIVESYNQEHISTLIKNKQEQKKPRFTIDPENGIIKAASDLLPGFYRFNVSVTDGKFIVYTQVSVDVSDINQESLDNSVSIKIRQLSVSNFVKEKMQLFYELLAREIGVSPALIRILSIQNKKYSKQQNTNHMIYKRLNSNLKFELNTTPSYKNFTTITTITEDENNNKDLEILFTVSQGALRGYYRPTYIKQKIENAINSILVESGLDIESISSEICRRDLCVKGDCRDRLWLDNTAMEIIEGGASNTLVLPTHVRTFECICKEGFSGRFCDVPINQCSKELCMRTEICIPSDEEPSGFICNCPPGFHGERCGEPNCNEPKTCSQREAISLLGNGYFQIALSSSIESRLELGLSFKSVSYNAVLMYGKGLNDFHELRIFNGNIEYRWDCGSGIGSVRISNIRVDDGAWHELKISRRGKHTTLSLDKDASFGEGTSPVGSDVINLYQQATILTFGAQVTSPHLKSFYAEKSFNTEFLNFNIRHRRYIRHHNHLFNRNNKNSIVLKPHIFRRIRRNYRNFFQSVLSTNYRETASELQNQIEHGMIGCFGQISIDGYYLSKTKQGLRLHNAAIGCDSSRMVPCLNVPCKNGGHCMPNKTYNSYSCNCPLRFTGSNCEIDLNACAGNPCPNGVPCHNLYNDFHCSCPIGFTGKTCQLRGDWDPCVTKPCGQYGTCIRQESTFICNCSNGFSGKLCADQTPKTKADGSISLNSFEFYLLLAVFTSAIFFSTFIVFLCQRCNLSNNSSLIRRSTSKVGNGSSARVISNKKNGVTKSLGKKSHDEETQDLLVTPSNAALSQNNSNDPPPLPPKFSKNAQFYQNLGPNAQHHSVVNTTNGLPTVEVRPMIALKTRVSSNSPLLTKTKINSLVSNSYQTSLNSNDNSIKSNVSKDQQPPPLPAHQSLSHINNSELAISNGCRNSILHKKNSRQIMLHKHNNSASSCKHKTKSSSCLLGCSAVKSHQNSPKLSLAQLENQNNLHHSQKAFVDNNIEDFKNLKNNKNTSNNLSKSNVSNTANQMKSLTSKCSDYLTMKPIHRAKPFNHYMSNENVDDLLINNTNPDQNEPPTPPAHRQKVSEINNEKTPKLFSKKCPCNNENCNNENCRKLYDNPTEN